MGCCFCKAEINKSFKYEIPNSSASWEVTTTCDQNHRYHKTAFYNNFYYAVLENNVKHCRALLDEYKLKSNKDDFENRDDCNDQQLPIIHLACMYRRSDVVQILTEHDVSLAKLPDHNGITPVYVCLRYWPRILPKVINTSDVTDEKLFWRSVTDGIENSCRCLQHLLRNGADPSEKIEGGRSLLHYAASKDLKQAIQVLMQYGADLEARDIDGCTPVIQAAANGRINSVKELLQHGAEVNVADNNGCTVLHYLCCCDFVSAETTLEIIKSGKVFDVNCTNIDGMTPMHLSAERGNGEKIQLLMAMGANADATDKFGRTPLFLLLDNIEPGFCCLGFNILCSEMKQISIYDKHGFLPKKLCRPNHVALLRKFEDLSKKPSSLMFLCFQTIRQTLGLSRITTNNLLMLGLPSSMIIRMIEHKQVVEL